MSLLSKAKKIIDESKDLKSTKTLLIGYLNMKPSSDMRYYVVSIYQLLNLKPIVTALVDRELFTIEKRLLELENEGEEV